MEFTHRAQHLGPALGGQDGVLAGAAPHVDQITHQKPSVGQFDHAGLRMADLPRRLTSVDVVPTAVFGSHFLRIG
jgi:hypothetical protein